MRNDSLHVVNEAQKLFPYDWQHCCVTPLRIRWGQPSPEGISGKFVSNDLVVWRMVSGQAVVETPQNTFHCKAGDWLFLGAGYRSQRFFGNAQLLSIAFQVCWPNSKRPVLDFRPGFLLSGITELDHKTDELHSLYNHAAEYEWHYHWTRSDLVTFLKIDGWFQRWLAAAIPLLRKHIPELETKWEADPRVEAARSWVMSLPVKVSITDFQTAANGIGLSLGHLNRLFAEHYNVTLHGFHEQRCNHYACQQLMQPEIRIKVIAHELGFCDLSKFSAWFKRLNRISPRLYRQRYEQQAINGKTS